MIARYNMRDVIRDDKGEVGGEEGRGFERRGEETRRQQESTQNR